MDDTGVPQVPESKEGFSWAHRRACPQGPAHGGPQAACPRGRPSRSSFRARLLAAIKASIEPPGGSPWVWLVHPTVRGRASFRARPLAVVVIRAFLVQRSRNAVLFLSGPIQIQLIFLSLVNSENCAWAEYNLENPEKVGIGNS